MGNAMEFGGGGGGGGWGGGEELLLFPFLPPLWLKYEWPWTLYTCINSNIYPVCMHKGKTIGFVRLSVFLSAQLENHQIRRSRRLSNLWSQQICRKLASLCFGSFGKAHERCNAAFLLATPIDSTHCRPCAFWSLAQSRLPGITIATFFA
jgi:hypothetical protein